MPELLQLPDVPVNGGTVGGGGGGTLVVADNPNQPSGLSSKRQRRPSVRLGEIGDQPATLTAYDSYRRNKQLWNDSRCRFYSQKVTGKSSSLSKTRPLTNLGNNGSSHETLETHENGGDDDNLGNSELLVSGNRVKGRDLKGKRGGGGGGGGTKRVRTNWGSSKTTLNEELDKFSGDDYYRDFDDGERSESPLKDGSPIHSLENTNVDLHKDANFLGQRKGNNRGGRVSESRDHDAAEVDVPSETDARDWKSRASVERSSDLGRCPPLEDGVRMWLIGLGLGRYESIFEMHEVDEEVLPLLTLEDLKDMGIDAVGSRRKLYSAIQKLGRGFS
ncbi:Sterile alpha motif (SAM) domain-containing protein [Thalictrum thalictroides]|uniref:Sterile alpha motif (SAM) domain-containing protein n=1 Tax=Thalictrum thalictroides TaxID=46969 RepID=A0A7J6V9U2_THATH|nr:Sterile alpha motif (SAM) domain-containing protein [Thalictrum thalictroides]